MNLISRLLGPWRLSPKPIDVSSPDFSIEGDQERLTVTISVAWLRNFSKLNPAIGRMYERVTAGYRSDKIGGSPAADLIEIIKYLRRD